MKTELEHISPEQGSSLSLMINPDLSDFFFWHFHPEFELVFIDGADGTRHVGEHISKFEGSDLVLIGSNIPHLNFDYGVKTSYEKIVIHLRADFPERSLDNSPELHKIKALFELSMEGVAFGHETIRLTGHRLKNLATLPPFEQYLELLVVLNLLAESEEKSVLHDNRIRNQYSARDQTRLKQVYTYIDSNYQHKIELSEVAEMSNLSKEAFCRYFKKMTKLTFTEFVNHYRIDKAKKLLLLDHNITEACFDCGFESISYFNRVFKRVTKENPLAFKKRYRTH